MAKKSARLWTDPLPATRFEDCTPHDTNDQGSWVTGLYIATNGNLRIQARDSDALCTVFAVVAGQIIPVKAKIVHTDTTATVKLLGG